MLTALLAPSADDAAAAVTVGGSVLTRGALLEAVSAIAGGLRAAGGPVAVHATASVETVVAVVGGLLTGVAVVPVPPDSGPVEREHVLRDSGATAWVGPAELAGGLPPVARRAGDLAPYDPDATALVLYTSGTTGLPKGVPSTGRRLTACLDGLAEAWAWTPDDTLVHGLPLFHLHGLVLGLLGPLRVGSPLVHTVRPSPAAYAAAPGTVYFGVPTVWHRVVGSPADAAALRGARLLVSGSAPLPVSTFTALQELTGLAPLERYGMTETAITLAARADEPPRAGWVGRPVGVTETRIVAADDEGMGRLQVRGPSVFTGYLGRASDDLGDDGWFATGDLAVRDPDGWHRLVGRESTDLIKTGGYRVGSGEVEAVLLDHPAVEEAAVVGVPDDDLGQRIVAYVVGSGATGREAELVSLVAERLSWHKRPRDVVVVDELPRNAMGKVQKTLLG
ncbi:AMP-binding protein [Nocardioides plantarum]|uniref:AMP-binding protein n=1 Tax=Nocardioides plantarum TaxID=29299 RepID=UPI001B8713C7|nr:AMP-binding protein [Nocardioides plantarum]